MMKRLATIFLVAVFLVLFAAPVFAQQQPTAEQAKQAADLAKLAAMAEKCHAEASLWNIEAEDWFKAEIDKSTADAVKAGSGLPNTTTVSKMGVEEIDARAKEMRNCIVLSGYNVNEKVGAEDNKLCDKVARDYDQISQERLEHFVLRRHLYRQFLQEDAAGKR